MATVTQCVLLRMLIRILKHLMLMSSRTQVKVMMYTAAQAGRMKAPRGATTRGLTLLSGQGSGSPNDSPGPSSATYPARFSAWDLRARQLRLEAHALCLCAFINISD